MEEEKDGEGRRKEAKVSILSLPPAEGKRRAIALRFTTSACS